MDEADRERLGGANPRRRQRQAARVALADRVQHVRTDRRRQDAELRLADGEARVVGGDRDVAGAGEADAAAERGALDARDGRLRAGVDSAQHRRELARVVEVPFDRRLARALHPVEVGAGAEVLAVAGEHDHAHAVVGAEPREGRVEFGDHLFVERVVDVRPRHRDLRDAGPARVDAQRFGLAHRSVSGNAEG